MILFWNNTQRVHCLFLQTFPVVDEGDDKQTEHLKAFADSIQCHPLPSQDLPAHHEVAEYFLPPQMLSVC